MQFFASMLCGEKKYPVNLLSPLFFAIESRYNVHVVFLVFFLNVILNEASIRLYFDKNVQFITYLQDHPFIVQDNANSIPYRYFQFNVVQRFFFIFKEKQKGPKILDVVLFSDHLWSLLLSFKR